MATREADTGERRRLKATLNEMVVNRLGTGVLRSISEQGGLGNLERDQLVETRLDENLDEVVNSTMTTVDRLVASITAEVDAWPEPR